MSILKSWIFWGNIIAVLIVGINYAITNNLFPQWIVYFSWAVAILDAILGIIKAQQNVSLKMKNSILERKISMMSKQK